MLQINFHLSSPQILAIHNTPVQVLPAPGSGKSHIVLACHARVTAGTIAYANGSDINIYIGPPANGLAGTRLSSPFLLNAGAQTTGNETPLNSSNETTPDLLDNQPLNLKATGAAYINGNGTMDGTIFYATSQLPQP